MEVRSCALNSLKGGFQGWRGEGRSLSGDRAVVWVDTITCSFLQVVTQAELCLRKRSCVAVGGWARGRALVRAWSPDLGSEGGVCMPQFPFEILHRTHPIAVNHAGHPIPL